MNKHEFKSTIEYKEKCKLIKLIGGTTVLINIMFDCVGLISFLYLKEIDNDVAITVLISIILVTLVITSPFIVYFCYLIKKLLSIYPKLNNMYIFEYKLGSPIEHKYFQSKYLVSFEYNDKKYDLMSYWIYDSNDLDNRRVLIGFIENSSSIFILKKVNN